MGESERLRNAKGLYLEGIRDGNMRAALEKYTGARYTQHSTGVRDGKVGFIEFFAPFLERNPVRDIRIVRAIEDGRYVFCHVYQNLNNGAAQWVTADLFDTDQDGRIVEHWDVIAAYQSLETAGRTMVNGPSLVQDLDRTEENKTTVRRFIETVRFGGKIENLSDFISAEAFVRHSPGTEDGLPAFRAHLDETTQSRSERYLHLHRLVGQGNFVVAFCEVEVDGGLSAVFDIFRLKEGRIVEHWDVREKIGAKETWNNSGKF